MFNHRLFTSTILTCLLLCSQPLYATTYKTNGDIIGTDTYYIVKRNDRLPVIARNFDIGLVELLAANPEVTPEHLIAGKALVLPTMHILPEPQGGIVLNLSNLRLFYYRDDDTVMTLPVGIGHDGWETPTGTTSITVKRKDPTWIVPDSIRKENPKLPHMVLPGPDNPLGQYALNLNWSGYRIHGTNFPYSVGKRTSHGCIRLYPEDIEQLFHAVSIGTPVTVIDTPYTLGWQGNTLWLEVMPTQQQANVIAKYKRPKPVVMPGIDKAIQEMAGDHTVINWDMVHQAVANFSGIPVAIGQKSP